MTLLDRMMADADAMVVGSFWDADGLWVLYVNFNAQHSFTTGSNATPSECRMLAVAR